MTDPLDRIVRTREQAHEVMRTGYALAKLLLDDGKRVRVVVGEDDEPLTVKQRRFFHGPVLSQIAEQVRMPDGTRYVAAIWKEFYRDLFLPAKWEVERRPRWVDGELVVPKRATPRRVKASTEDLSVKQYSELIDKVIAHATTELGVVFDLDPAERQRVRYVAPARKRQEEVAA